MWGNNDPQRPHDLGGKGSKFSWPVFKGLAVQNRSDDPNFFKKYVLPSIEIHRKYQYHHQKWNSLDFSTDVDDIKEGAVDSLCSWLEDRSYQGGVHNFEQILQRIKKMGYDDPYRAKWMHIVYFEMLEKPQPDLRGISLDVIPNVGLPKLVQGSIVERLEETKRSLCSNFGYEL